jgi:hypothetical protein
MPSFVVAVSQGSNISTSRRDKGLCRHWYCHIFNFPSFVVPSPCPRHNPSTFSLWDLSVTISRISRICCLMKLVEIIDECFEDELEQGKNKY